MRIAFYAPMKAPDHPVPSGDREMARLLTAALTQAGHTVELVSNLRSFLAQPDPPADAAIARAAAAEVERIAAGWSANGTPDLIFAYHLHYKAPDRVALPLARRFGVPYLTAEASYARKRADGPWGDRQDQVVEAVRHATLNLCFTANDRAGLAEIVKPDRLVDLPPFIDTSRFPARQRGPGNAVPEIVTVAMMRPGDKLDSYRFLAASLARLDHLDWRLTVVGGGPVEADVRAALATLPPGLVRQRGVRSAQEIAAILAAADLFAWPGFNEAFGLCYLEAAATGLPCVAVHGEGTPSVILHEQTGLLTPPDPDAYAAALARLLADRPGREAMGRAAARFVHRERGLPEAAVRLDAAVRRAVAAGPRLPPREATDLSTTLNLSLPMAGGRDGGGASPLCTRPSDSNAGAPGSG